MVVLSVLDRGLRTYNGCLYAQPLLTKACTSAFTGALGDFLGQLITRQPSINFYSMARYASFGFFVTGPLAHNFYKKIDKLVPATERGAAIKRLLVDRLMFAPLLLLLSLYLLSRLEGKSHRTCANEIQLKYWAALKMNWKVWTPVQYININYIPQQYRSLFANCVAVFWIIYLTNKRRQAAAAASKSD
ncbi:peroxisomal membrane protein 2-like [Homarus americanus]|uniref:Peroxisomal membrane protein 2-like n=1 Tax=Homarus americanus TaxID=6706 RepID=A0A8J5K5R7_HOMAM|nr:peroxisomal membrane protein 2-like [Homarus americanus]XP_042220064.1 peroxisomal membrane protein 2-like [Homarus americanus]XP_042220066.1 peroxisomal membrane protein 2-like [Homarus americanus]XP_042220067.1 peroxisomal membrane protein 2-like [Homarus americanus]KAG7169996.1 Peroxisomal membrane protein 2-like [Homarus americanus]